MAASLESLTTEQLEMKVKQLARIEKMGCRAIDLKRVSELELADLKLAKQRGEVVDRETVEECIHVFMAAIREAIEQLGRAFGEEAQRIVLEQVDTAESRITERLDDLAIEDEGNSEVDLGEA